MGMLLGGLLLFSCYVGYSEAQYASATCDMAPNPSFNTSHPLYQNIRGSVTFRQEYVDGPVALHISLSGFNTTDGRLKHGFHVHESGDIKYGCENGGPHFNPTNKQHGGREDRERHVGDLGNIEEDGQGGVMDSIIDTVIKFEGVANISGRMLDIHETEDDLGRGGNAKSLASGNAGKRIACCVITVSRPVDRPDFVSGAMSLVSSVMTSFILLAVTSVV